MSYISACRHRGSSDVIIWERTSHGREVFQVPAPFYFYVENPEGKYTTIFEQKCSKLTFKNATEMNAAKDQCKQSGLKVFESDISPELRVLSERYFEKDPPKLHYTLLDIEVDYSPDIGFAGVDNPYAPINAVALYHEWLKKAICIAVPPDKSWTLDKVLKGINDVVPVPQNLDFEMILVDSERQLLLKFLELIDDSDVLSGWHSNGFDMPYIALRLEKLGKTYPKRLCFPEGEDISWREVELYGNMQKFVEISGRIHLDYLELFKKYAVAERPSYKLEAIAEEFLPDLPKLSYEGSLAKLYKDDFAYFVRYNIRDTEILAGFEQKLGYLDVANRMVHISTGLFKHVTGTLKLAELSCINFCHHKLNLIVNDIKQSENTKIKGAYVLLPQIGESDWISNVDVTSLYPSAIRSINLSPEMLIGQFVEEVEACEEIFKRSNKTLTLVLEKTGEHVIKTAAEFREYFIFNKYAVSGFGTVFSQEKEGIIPSILSDWFKTRKEYQRRSKDAAKKAESILKKYKN